MIFFRNARLVLFCFGAALGTLSCSAPTPHAPESPAVGTAGGMHDTTALNLKATYTKLAESGGKVFTLDPSTSAIRIYAFRGGRMARLGHNHVLSAPQFTGFFHLPAPGSASGTQAATNDAQFDLEFRLDQLEIDRPEYRAPLGKAFASVPSPEAIAGTREHMLGESNFQADKFPFVRVHALQIIGDAPKFAARVEVEMHGQKRDFWVPLTVEGLPEHLRVMGSFVLRQTDFGIQPYAVLGGLMSVDNAVVIDFTLAGV